MGWRNGSEFCYLILGNYLRRCRRLNLLLLFLYFFYRTDVKLPFHITTKRVSSVFHKNTGCIVIDDYIAPSMCIKFIYFRKYSSRNVGEKNENATSGCVVNCSGPKDQFDSITFRITDS